MEKEDKIFRVLIPTEEEYEFKDGKKKDVYKRQDICYLQTST